MKLVETGFIGALVIVAIVGLLSLFGIQVFHNKPPQIDLPNTEGFDTWEPTDQQLIEWVGASEAVNIIVHEYNVDVKVSNSHAWNRHDVQATNALRCLTQNGTFMILSEKDTRNLHLLCIDPKTKEAFVVIIAKILRYANDAKNATSYLLTAFQLTNVTVDEYIKAETQFKAIIVRLSFSPGELFFAP